MDDTDYVREIRVTVQHPLSLHFQLGIFLILRSYMVKSYVTGRMSGKSIYRDDR